MTANSLSDRTAPIGVLAADVAPKRKRGRPRRVTTDAPVLTVVGEEPTWEPEGELRDEIIAECAFALAMGHDLEEYTFESYSPIAKRTKAAIIREARKAAPAVRERVEREREETLAEQVASARAEAEERAKAEAHRCATCNQPCQPYQTICSDCQQARERAYEARQREWTLRAYDRADALFNDVGADEARLVLMLTIEIGAWEGVADYADHVASGLAHAATRHTLERHAAMKASQLDNKARRSRATLALSQRVRDWRDARDDLDVYDVAIIEAQLQNVNGTTGLAYCAAETIARRGHVNETTVRRHLRKLADLGLYRLEAGRGNRRPNRCTFLV
jgi:hypothetical protein